jgi:hypothetical protein
VRDFVCIIRGSQKSVHFSKIFCSLIQHLEHTKQLLTKDMLEAYLELFTVLFLKSDDCVKCVLLADLFSLLVSLKEQELALFVDGTFGMKIMLFRIYQIKNCLRHNTDCGIKQRLFAKARFSDNPETCAVHPDFDASLAMINLSNNQPQFISIICFFLTLTIKLIKSAGLDLEQRQNFPLILDLLFNFTEFCPPKFIYYPIRALFEFFQKDATDLLLNKQLNSSLMDFKKNKGIKKA